jgi:hypothetical protein
MELGKKGYNDIAYPEAKPKILILGCDGLNCSVWENELERHCGINGKPILARLPRISFGTTKQVP